MSVFLSFVIVLAEFAAAQPPKPRPGSSIPVFRNTGPEVHYVGSKICAGCHSEIADRFSKTEMGNSMFRHTRLLELGWLTKPVDLYNESHHRHYRIYQEGSKVFESEYEVDEKGNEVFRHTEELEYVIGTGTNGATPIVHRGKYLFEAPLSYYAATKSWNLSPNFDVQDIGFSLPVTSDCIGCHSGRTQPVRGHDGKYDDPAVLEEGIACEKCHGPGELHVLERRMEAPIATNIDTSIVNPAKLPTWLADNICMNCHEGDIRVLQKGKSWEDFRPGTPLNDTFAILKEPIDPQEKQSPLLEHYYSMTLSKCYRASGEKLGCQSCHDPHVQPTRHEAQAYFREKCLRCHTEQSCRVDMKERLAQQPEDACTNCHMRKEPALTVSHSALTDHRIRRSDDEPYPQEAFRATLAGTGFIHINAVPGKTDSVAPVALLKAYRQELVRSRLKFKSYYFALLERLIQSGNKNGFVLSSAAQKASSDGDLAQAIGYARRAVDAGGASESDYLLLARLLDQSSDSSASIEVLKRGLAAFPFSNSLYEDLVTRQLSGGKTDDAIASLKNGLQLFPEDLSLRNMLQTASLHGPTQRGLERFERGDLQGALQEFRTAVEANSGDAVAHDYIGIILGEEGSLSDAISHFRQASRLDPTFADPHEHLALADVKVGQVEDAIAEYQQALRLNPQLTQAKYGLSEACTKIGDLDGAILMLQQVTEAKSDFAEAHYNLGLSLWNRYKKSSGLRQKSDLEDAAKQLQKAADLEPRNAGILEALGQIEVDQGDLSLSAENLRKAVNLDPSNAEFHYDLGLALRLKGEFDAAAEQFRAALSLAPQHALARRSLGLVLRETGDLNAAAAELRESVKQLPDDAQGHHLLGTVLLKQSDLNDAITEFRAAITLDPNLMEARANLAQALQKAGQREASQQQSEQLRKIKEDASNIGQSMVLVQTASDYMNKREVTEAVRSLQEAVSLTPTFVEAQYQLGVALRRLGNDKESEEISLQVLKLEPDHARAHLNLGLLFSTEEDTDHAADELQKALQAEPSLSEAHFALGKLAERAQNWETAVREFQTVIVWDPQNGAAHYELAQALRASGQTEEASRELRVAQQLLPDIGSTH
jgi:tetratricopeptide (TPR) repeat protein